MTSYAPVENTLMIPHELSVANAPLPKIYESAKLALNECNRIDECKDWANKAEALASYARQSEDKTLLSMAVKIQARAIRRCGELLKEIQPATGAHLKSTGDHTFSRKEVAEDAGLSRHQRITATRVASIPSEQFDSLVESETPPTVTKLAEIGTKPQQKPLVDLKGRDPYDFALSTQGQGSIERMYKTAQEIDASAVVRGASAQERIVIDERIQFIAAWFQVLRKEMTANGR